MGLSRVVRLRPSAYFLTEQAKLLPILSTRTLDRVSEMFKRLNACLTS